MKLLFITTAILSILLLTPINLYIKYGEDTLVRIRYMIFSSVLFPQKPKPEKPKKPEGAKRKRKKKQDEAEEQQRDSKKPTDTREMLSLLWKMLSVIPRPLRKLLRRIRISGIVLRMALVGDDAGDAGLRAGRTNAWVYAGYTAAEGIFTVERADILILPEFILEQDRVHLEMRIRVTPFAVLALLMSVLIGFTAALIKDRLNKKPDPKRSAEEKMEEDENVKQCK